MKKTLITVAVILVVIVAGLLVAPVFIPVETYKAQIETAAREATGRELKIDGDISLSLLPRLAIEAENVSFANAPGAAEPQMASIEKLAVQLQILPLLSREVKLDRLVLVRPSILLEVDAQGRPNWAFETASKTSGAPAQESEAPAAEPSGDSDGGAAVANVALGEVRLEGGRLAYRDARSGAAYEVEDVNMDVSLASLDSPLNAEGGLVWNGKTVSLELAADRPRALLEGGTTSLGLKIDSEPVQLRYDGSLDKGQTLQMAAAVDLNVPSIRALAAWAGTPLELAGDGLGPFAIRGKLAATPTRFAFTEAEIGLDGMAGQGALTADISGAKPDIRGELKLDVLDANKYLPPEAASTARPRPTGTPRAMATAGTRPASPKPQEWSDEPIDLAGLQAVNLDFDLVRPGHPDPQDQDRRVGARPVAIKDGLLTADLRQLKLYEGIGRAELALDGRGASPSLRNSFTLTGVNAGTLLTDAADFDRLGRQRRHRDLASAPPARARRRWCRPSMATARSSFVDGAIRGINLAQMIRNVTSAFTDTGECPENRLRGAFRDLQDRSGGSSGTMTCSCSIRCCGSTAPVPQTCRSGPSSTGSSRRPWGPSRARAARRRLKGLIAVPVIVEGPWHDLTYRPDLAAVGRRRSRQGDRGAPKMPWKGPKMPAKSLLKGLTGQGGGEETSGGRWREGGTNRIPSTH